MDTLDETGRALNYLRYNAADYRSRFGYDRDSFRYIIAIKQLREDLGIGLRPAKDAMDQWRDAGFPASLSPSFEPASMDASRAKLLVQNLLLRGVPGLTHLEKDAIRFLVR